MDYEKKYKEALELARDYYKANQKLGESKENEVLSDIFPELKESDDEKIRGAIIDHLKDNNLTEWAAWLKKQGNKPFNYENANIQQKDFAPKSQRMMSAKAKEALYGKPTWSEEDEKMYLSIMSVLLSTIGTGKNGFTVTREVDWLKSLKDKVQSLSKPKEWSEEDERMLNHIIGYLHSGDDFQTGIDWLKSIKERIGG